MEFCSLLSRVHAGFLFFLEIRESPVNICCKHTIDYYWYDKRHAQDNENRIMPFSFSWPVGRINVLSIVQLICSLLGFQKQMCSYPSLSSNRS
jgi:hypothetical protein